MDFSGRVALVTGGASGIGAAVARRLAARGAAIVIADRDLVGATALRDDLVAKGARAIAIQMDVSDPASVAAGVSKASELGPLRLLVNSAGITGTGHLIGETPADDWRQVMAVNLDGPFHTMNATFPVMAAAGGGAVVNVSSVMGTVAAGRFAGYTAAKHGLIGLTKAAALDGVASGIRVNSVGPGFIDSPLQAGPMDVSRRAEVAARHPLGRWGTADEVAALIIWLLSEEAAFVTG
ncbi:MAG: SDR family NAD(P)-dependent oxidoreductase, partial [Gemmobacter sp.]|nr:SDR family NAD(P)-dependent oxidoreductase [Gemmobacter sp.]